MFQANKMDGSQTFVLEIKNNAPYNGVKFEATSSSAPYIASVHSQVKVNKQTNGHMSHSSDASNNLSWKNIINALLSLIACIALPTIVFFAFS